MGERLFEGIKVAQLYQQHRLGYNGIGLEKEILAFMSSSLKQGNYSLAVDVGCGTGLLTRVLAPHFTKVIGVDISPGQIQVAKECTKEDNVDYRKTSAEDMTFLRDESVDLVTCALANHYFDTDLFLKEADRILKPEGCLAVIQVMSFGLTPETNDADVINRCKCLMNEVYQFNLSQLSDKAKNGIRADIARSKIKSHSFSLKSERRGKIEIVSRFMNALGGVRKFCRENPGSGDMGERYKTRFLEVLKDVSPSPETVPVTLSNSLYCRLYKKPFVINEPSGTALSYTRD